MKKNSGKADALEFNGDEPLGNQPSNNANDRSGILIAEVDQDRSVSFDVGNSFCPFEMPRQALTYEEMLSLRDEKWWEDSFLTISEEICLADILQGEGASNEQDGHAVVRPKENQRMQSFPRSGTESSSGSTTPGDFEIYANGQEFPESSSSSSTTAEQEIYFKGHEWPESRGYRSACRSQSQRRLSNKSDSKTQKPTAIHLSQKKSSDDSGKIKRQLVESENDQKMVVAAASSKLRTFMNSLIRFETLPSSHRQNPPFVYIATVLVGLVLLVVISREMLICH